MTDRAALTKLLEMVEAGTGGPDTIWGSTYVVPSATSRLIEAAFGDDDEIWGNVVAAHDGSLDAAKALHEAVLPGCKWGIHEPKPGVFRAYVSEWSPFRPMPTTCEADSPARAWMIAIIRAKIAEGEG